MSNARKSGDFPPEGFSPILSSNPFARPLGPIYEREDETGFRRGFRVREDHCNAAGTVHGGMLSTFADIVLARAVQRATGAGAITMRLTVDFLAPARPGQWLEGSARVTGIDADRAETAGELTADGRLIARTTARFKVRTTAAAGVPPSR